MSNDKTDYVERPLSAALLISTGLGAALPSASALANDQVTLRLDWTIEGQHLPFIWAQDKGYYPPKASTSKSPKDAAPAIPRNWSAPRPTHSAQPTPRAPRWRAVRARR